MKRTSRLLAPALVAAVCALAPSTARAHGFDGLEAAAYSAYGLLVAPAVIGGTITAVGRATSDDANDAWRFQAYGFGAYNLACVAVNGVLVGALADDGQPEAILFGVVGTVNLGLAITNFVVAAMPKTQPAPVTVTPVVSLAPGGSASMALALSGAF